MMIFVFVFQVMFVILGMFIVTLFAGMCGYSCEVLSDLEDCMCCLAVLCFPVTMIVGIGRAFQELFCDVVGSALE